MMKVIVTTPEVTIKPVVKPYSVKVVIQAAIKQRTPMKPTMPPGRNNSRRMARVPIRMRVMMMLTV